MPWAASESGGDYAARNRLSGAYGKYQIMPSSWRAWADRYLGDPNAIPTPANQELVAEGQGPIAVQRSRKLAARRLLVADGVGP